MPHIATRMQKRARAVLTVVLLAAAGLSATGVPAQAAAPSYLTLMMGRAVDAQALDTKCQTIAPGSVSLATTAAYLAQHGLRATAPVTLDEIGATTPTCSSRVRYATWKQLAALRDSYGWDVVPRGAHQHTITGETGSQLYDDTCGILPTFYGHGYPDAWGMYAYPQNRWDTTDQQTVDKCYGYGRKYTGLGRTNWMPLPSPYWQRTISVNGGRCNDSSLSCYSDPLVKHGRRYMLPGQLDASVSTSSNAWTAIQYYRLVTGSQGSSSTSAGLPAWDCTSSNPAKHWSHLPEDYCYSDFQSFVTGLPAGVTDASPADVARVFSRDMSGVTP